MHPSLLHHPGIRLSPAELSACRLDGELFEIGDAYAPADMPDSREARALSLLPLSRPTLAFSGPSAAWLHGARTDPPARHHVRPTTARRIRVPATALLRVHEAVIADADVERLASVSVTGVTETFCDLARMDEAEAGPWLRALAEEVPRSVLEAAEQLRSRFRVPGKLAAIRRLENVYEEVTRYTS